VDARAWNLQEENRACWVIRDLRSFERAAYPGNI
jgi:hypothetical protein